MGVKLNHAQLRPHPCIPLPFTENELGTLGSFDEDSIRSQMDGLLCDFDWGVKRCDMTATGPA